MVLEGVVISEIGLVDESLPLLLKIIPCFSDASAGRFVFGPVLNLMFASAIEEYFTSTATL
jgi:hypothetical protein